MVQLKLSQISKKISTKETRASHFTVSLAFFSDASSSATCLAETVAQVGNK